MYSFEASGEVCLAITRKKSQLGLGIIPLRSIPAETFDLVSPSAGRLCHESPPAQVSASLRLLHSVSPLRVCVRAPTRVPTSLRGGNTVLSQRPKHASGRSTTQWRGTANHHPTFRNGQPC